VKLHLPAPQWGGPLALSPDSSLLALGGANLSVHAVSDGRSIAGDGRYGNNIDTIRFTPQADLLLTSSYDGKARSYALPADLETLASLPRPQSLSHGRANVYALAMTPDGRRLVTSSGDQTLKVWAR
jgi:WD40 repeat protein